MHVRAQQWSGERMHACARTAVERRTNECMCAHSSGAENALALLVGEHSVRDVGVDAGLHGGRRCQASLHDALHQRRLHPRMHRMHALRRRRRVVACTAPVAITMHTSHAQAPPARRTCPPPLSSRDG
jgi:hypothetical protein